MERLIVFTRYPRSGKAKTRLIPALGADGAAMLQRQMTEHTLQHVRSLVEARLSSVEIWFAGGDDSATDRQLMQAWLGSEWVYRPQASGNLGERMAQAFQTAFAAGVERVVTIGTDCPSLDASLMSQAFQALHTHDLVLGPATDGGYYLIGLSRFVPELFDGIAWSTDQVLQQTVTIAQHRGLTIAYLDPLTDIDRPEDLSIWQAICEPSSCPDISVPGISVPDISVIVPVLNEANSIQTVLQTIQQAQGGSDSATVEVIVVDGGSHDETVAEAEMAGAKVITATMGRSLQMNAGAHVATGKILLFLHADTRLPAGYAALVKQTLSHSGVVAGAFDLHIDGTEPGLRLVEWGVKWRSRLLQLPYGDQAIFLKAETFHQIGGFPALPIMEDFVLMRRLQRLGTIAIAPAAVTTSARRWQKLGILRTTLINQWVIAAYYLGIPLDQIARWYQDKK